MPDVVSTTPAASVADAHLALAMEAVEMGAWHWDIPRNTVTWSASLERIHGLEAGTFPGTFEAYQRDIHPDDRDRVLTTIRRSVDERQPHYLSYRIVRPDGEIRWLEARGRLFLDNAGQPERLVGVCMDVTSKREHEAEWREAQRRHRESEAALRDQQRMSALTRDISLALTRETDMRAMLQRCAETVVDHLGAAFARIWTLSESGETLELQTSAGMYTHIDGPHGRVPVGKFKIGLIAQERKPHLTNEVLSDPRIGDPGWARREGMVAFAGYPLMIGDALVGVLAMFARHQLSEADFTGLGTVANAVAVGIARARADAAIRASEERYRFLAEATPTHVWTTDANGELDYVNSQARQYFGGAPQEMRQDDRARLVHPDDAAMVAARWVQCRTTGEPLEVEYRLRRHDGQYRWHIVRAHAFRDAGGTITKWFGTNTDVHDLKLARETLSARADELSQLARELEYQRDLTMTITDNTASALFMMDTNGLPLFMNAAACAMTGYSGIEDIAGRPLHEVVHFRKADGAPYPIAECPIDRANADLVALRAQREVFCRKDGTLFPVEYNVAPITRDGQRLGAVLEVRDITHELAAQRALRESDERFHLLARATNDAIWDWNFDANTVWWNENFRTMFGYDLAALEPGPESWTSRIHPDDLERIAHGIHEAIDGTAAVWADEYRFRRADGSYADIFDRGIIVRDSGGRARRMMGSMMDITARKQAEASLRRHADHLAALTAALQRSNRDLDQFAYVASHDLKAPLRGIANLSQWLEEDLGTSLPESSRDHLKLLRSRVHRMEGLIDGILQYSRAGRVTGAPERVPVRRVIADVLDMLSPPAAVSFDIAPDLPVLTTHRLPLQQVFLNLVGNAVKYGATAPDPQVRITWRETAAVPEFAVTDNGAGIDPSFHERIWGIFQTLQPRDEVEGTGIGLALVKKIVESRGGRVSVESEAGRGATFRFTWPATAEGETRE